MRDIQEQLKELRTLVQELGWKEFMFHLGSIMSEQSDNTIGDQSSALFSASNTLFALQQVWHTCGKFVYPNDMVNCQRTGE